MKKIIYLSPSNHGKNQNKCLMAECYEDKHTRPIAEACAEILRKNSFDVIVGKPSQNMAARCKEADAVGADLYVPIHTNASASPEVGYLMFMFYKDAKLYRQIFNAVAPHLEAIYPGRKRAVFAERPKLYEINRPKAKTIYCELGFHTNPTDCGTFIHDAEKVGKALAFGICQYYGVRPQHDNSAQDNPPAEKTISQGNIVKLVKTPIFATSVSKNPANYVTGTYYLWDGKIIKERVRITNLPERVGVKGQVTGWIDKKIIGTDTE